MQFVLYCKLLLFGTTQYTHVIQNYFAGTREILQIS